MDENTEDLKKFTFYDWVVVMVLSALSPLAFYMITELTIWLRYR